ncbi:hypothetical protein FGADI_3379 [Fusarium gaditjirri]|uniref:Mid2 domain-containing protein n=1 Tax=Fusarium gaditjirri TaxID=282569 RepID=A0A8H4TFY9_9HYPO|nr:hypothetical protein FGADI_3379 [Fusarium gaditjirri]
MSDPTPATTLDPNVWYHITEQAVDPDYKNDFKAMLQTNQDTKANDTNLHVWPVKTNKQAVKAYWQFTGAYKQLAVCFSSDIVDEDTRTRPCLLDAINDETQQWDVAEWKSNNTYRFINAHNGTKFHLDCIPNGPVFMSPDVDDTPYQTRQHWLMTSASSVNDKSFSTTISEVSSTTSEDSQTSTTGSESSSSNGNNFSSGKIVGISVGLVLGVIALAISLAAFFLWRARSTTNRKSSSPDSIIKADKGRGGVGPVVSPYQHFSPEDVGNFPKCTELDGDPVDVKVSSDQRHELP